MAPVPEIPGIEMSGDDDDLLRMFGTFEVGNDVVPGLVRKLFRSEDEMHAHLALRGEVDDEIGIFGRDRAGRNSCRKTESGVGKAVVGVADRSDQSCDGAKIGCGFGSRSAIADRLAIGRECEPGSAFLLVEELVEEHDFSGNFAATERLEFLERVDRDYIGRKAVSGGGGAAAKSGQNDLLRSSGNHAGILDERGGLRPADPMRHDNRLEANFEPQLSKFRSHVLGRSAGLR